MEIFFKLHINPIKVANKEKYYYDLTNIRHSWTHRIDVQFINLFMEEAHQLIINSILMLEQGFFDAAFYSLRQSLELSTTIVYLSELNEIEKKEKLKSWKSKERFPMVGEMLKFLNKNKEFYKELSESCPEFFKNIKITKDKLNKYVHKQGYDTFYIKPMNPHPNDSLIKIRRDFEKYLNTSIGALAFFRLMIDTFPILLADEEIFHRTEYYLTRPFQDEFIEEYIGKDTIDKYKKTSFYNEQYSYFMSLEKRFSCVSDIIKNQYINRELIPKIKKQFHLLSEVQQIVVKITEISKKITFITDCFSFYDTSTKSLRGRFPLNTEEYHEKNKDSEKINLPFKNIFLSIIIYNNESIFIEHNESLDLEEKTKLVLLAAYQKI